MNSHCMVKVKYHEPRFYVNFPALFRSYVELQVQTTPLSYVSVDIMFMWTQCHCGLNVSRV